MAEKLYTLQESANLIGVKLKTIYNWRYKRLIPSYKRYTATIIEDIQQKFMHGKLVV